MQDWNAEQIALHKMNLALGTTPHPDAILAGILRRFLHADRWWADDTLLAINDTVDLTSPERDAIRAETQR